MLNPRRFSEAPKKNASNKLRLTGSPSKINAQADVESSESSVDEFHTEAKPNVNVARSERPKSIHFNLSR